MREAAPMSSESGPNADIDSHEVPADEIDRLHDALFDERPTKRGDRFERLVAVVFAALGEGVVAWQVRRRGPSRRAQHWIDVVVHRADATRYAIVECKHWKKLVDQDVLNSVVSRRDQLGAAEAVVVSTAGFTSGARDVAADEAVRLVKLVPLREGDSWQGVLKEIHLDGRFAAPDLLELQWRAVDPDEVVRLRALGVESRWDESNLDFSVAGVEMDDGTPAERVRDLLNRSPSPFEDGTFSHRVELEQVRFLRVDPTHRVAVNALEWTEQVTIFETRHVIGPQSPGLVLVEETLPSGKPARRVLMDHQLRPWQLDDRRRVVPRSSPQSG